MSHEMMLMLSIHTGFRPDASAIRSRVLSVLFKYVLCIRTRYMF